MAYGGAGLGAGEEEVFDPLLDVPLPKDVEDIDFAIDYYESAKDFLKVANSKFPDSSSDEKRYRGTSKYEIFIMFTCSSLQLSQLP